jgi:glycerate dehydrogenase
VSHHIVYLEGDSLQADVRRPSFEHTWTQYASTTPDQIVPRLADATIAIVNKAPLSATTLQALPKLQLVAVAATGYDRIDIDACRARGIALANIRNYAVHTVPEHAFALILALRRNLLAYRQDVERGAWQKAENFCFFNHDISDLHGSTLGIVGEGAIGQAVGAIGRAFGMKVLFADHVPPCAEGVTFTPFAEVLARADVLSLHCPLTPATRDLIGIRELRQMKPTALLINTARGGLVNEADLVEALDEGLIAGAGFDVLTTEPPRSGHLLLELRRPNFILTPHVAWASGQAMQFLADQLIDNVERWAAGIPQHRVA